MDIKKFCMASRIGSVHRKISIWDATNMIWVTVHQGKLTRQSFVKKKMAKGDDV